MLIRCPECHKKVSSQSDACPYCGYDKIRKSDEQIMEETKKDIKENFIAIIIMLAIIVAFIGVNAILDQLS